ncbi:FixH family protein [Thiogranum longum]|uniref:FixH family protein n=1 Tax=Thiogranum longum TaxID=1537524 RepID=UPI001A9CBFDD|nr:FixH family protein [Thiogranum longum]
MTHTRTSSEGLYEVTIESRQNPLQLGRMHAWTATIRTPEGAPVTGARIKVGGGMPIHNHGFPTEPEVTRELEAGVYLIEGVKFSMRGPWVIFLDITAGDQSDSVAFDIDM